MDIQYRAHVQNIGWQDWVQNGEVAGTTGQALQMEAIQIDLTGVDSTDNLGVHLGRRRKIGYGRLNYG